MKYIWKPTLVLIVSMAIIVSLVIMRLGTDSVGTLITIAGILSVFGVAVSVSAIKDGLHEKRMDEWRT